MPHRLLTLDGTTILLSATSAGATVVAWMTEHEIMGGFVLFTIGVLNLGKTYAHLTGKKKDKKI